MNGLFCMTAHLDRARAIYATPGLTGVFLAANWADVAPSPGVFDWTVLDQQLALIPPGAQLVVGLCAGLQAPAWLKAAGGCPTLALTIPTHPGGAPQPVTVPVPWLDGYLEEYLDAMRALADHLTDTGNMVRVVGVKASIYHGIDFEMTIPGGAACGAQWAAAGYTPGFARNQWMWAFDDLASMFPGVTLSIPLLSPSDSLPDVDDTGSVITGSTELAMLAYLAAAGAQYGSRAQVIDTALSTVPVPAIYTDAVSAGCALGFQTNAWGPDGTSATGKHGAPGPSDLPAVIANGRALGATYFELHPEDVEAHSDVIAELGG